MRRRHARFRAPYPTMFSDLRAWYDASRLTGSEGDGIETWDNAEGTSTYDASQSTANERPDLRLASVNSLNSIDFEGDGADDYLEVDKSLFESLSEITVFAVAGRLSTGTRAHMLSMSHGGDDERQFQFYINTGASPVIVMGMGGTTSFTAVASSGGSGDFTPTNSNIFTGTAKNGEQVELFVNGSEVSSYGIQNNAATMLSSMGHNIAMGRENADGATVNANMRMAELIVYGRKLTAAELQGVWDYLSAKWGVALS